MYEEVLACMEAPIGDPIVWPEPRVARLQNQTHPRRPREPYRVSMPVRVSG